MTHQICESCGKKYINAKKHASRCIPLKKKEPPFIRFPENITEHKIKYIDLFAGTGAFSLCLKNFAECVFSNDIEKSSETIYKLNFPNHNFVLGNLHDVKEVPDHDILCAGFPCQPFSIAGKQKGFDDERANVFNKVIDILTKKKPEYVILENVKNLKSHDKGNTYKVIEEKLSGLGYFIKTAILDTSKITYIPQHRERIFIVCFKNKDTYNKFNFDFPKVNNVQIKNLLEHNVSDKYYYTDRFKVYAEINKCVTKTIDDNVIYQYRRHYVRENKSNLCPTLTANMGSGGHNVPLIKDNKGIRKLTPRECFNLQGFPESYKLPNLNDGALYKLAGNAVSVPVIQLIINRLLFIE